MKLLFAIMMDFGGVSDHPLSTRSKEQISSTATINRTISMHNITSQEHVSQFEHRVDFFILWIDGKPIHYMKSVNRKHTMSAF